MPRNWGDDDWSGEHEDGGPVVIALLVAVFWGFVLGWLAHVAFTALV